MTPTGPIRRRFLIVIALIATLVACAPALAVEGPWAASAPDAAADPPADTDERPPPPRGLEGVDVSEKLGDTVPLDLSFTDDRGRRVVLADYFRDDRPVVLTLNYYRCPRLCNLQLNGLSDLVDELKWVPGQEYQILTLSFDPAETSMLARMKKQNYIKALGRSDRARVADGWHFLTGERHQIRRLAESVGFGYKWVEARQQFAHPALMVVLTPEGVISRYLYGISFDPKTARLSMVEASEGRVGSAFDQFLLTCFHYDPADGTYKAGAMTMMRLGGVLTVLVLGGAIGLMLLREFAKRKSAADDATTNPTETMKAH